MPAQDPPVGSARDELLQRVVAHIATSGLRDQSLRQIAMATGTSHRMLHYHFGGRDGLVAAVVDAVEEQQRASLDALSAGAGTPEELIRAQWGSLTDPQLRPFVALFFELLALAARRAPGTAGFLDRITDPWLDLGERLAADLGIDVTRAEVRLGVAVVRGLLIDVLASGDTEPATESIERYLELWNPTDD